MSSILFSRSSKPKTSRFASVRSNALFLLEGLGDLLRVNRDRIDTVIKVSGISAVVVAAFLLVSLTMSKQILLEIDGGEERHHRRIKSFASDVRVAADALRDERAECTSVPARDRGACLEQANKSGRSAVAAARDRYSRDEQPTQADATKSSNTRR